MVDLWNPFVTPGTLPEMPETFPESKYHFLYINLYLRTIPELLVTSGISSGDFEIGRAHV